MAETEEGQEPFFLGAENALRARPKDEEALKDEQIKKLKQKIGDLVMDIDILRELAKRHPTTPGASSRKAGVPLLLTAAHRSRSPCQPIELGAAGGT